MASRRKLRQLYECLSRLESDRNITRSAPRRACAHNFVRRIFTWIRGAIASQSCSEHGRMKQRTGTFVHGSHGRSGIQPAATAEASARLSATIACVMLRRHPRPFPKERVGNSGSDCGSGPVRSAGARHRRSEAIRPSSVVSPSSRCALGEASRARGSRRAERPRGPHANGRRRGAHRRPFPPVATIGADSCFPPLLMRRAPSGPRCEGG